MDIERRYTGTDWALTAGVAAMWGSSFLFIGIGVEHAAPALVALLRLTFGALSLAAVPAARRPVARSDWPAVALLGLVWMAGPFLLFAVAERSLDTSAAGMLNGAAPVFTALVAGIASRQLPRGRRLSGLAAGLAGVVLIGLPSLLAGHATAAGAAYVLLATVLYGVAFNLAAPLQRRHGALPVIWRAQLSALMMLAPFGLASVPGSRFTWPGVAAVAALGCLGTAAAFAGFTTLAGRVGPARASVTVYLLPAIAILLGAVFRSETIHPGAIAGTVLVLLGAYLTSQPEPRMNPTINTMNGASHDRQPAIQRTVHRAQHRTYPRRPPDRDARHRRRPAQATVAQHRRRDRQGGPRAASADRPHLSKHQLHGTHTARAVRRAHRPAEHRAHHPQRLG
jgi:drug/metabolite transporter (DMT)-like permease